MINNEGIIARRKAVNPAAQNLVRFLPLEEGVSLPLLVQPGVEGVSLLAWATNNQATIKQHLLLRGALLFRKFNPLTVEELEQFVGIISGEPLAYRERSSPRHQVAGKIYTSTDYPANQSIFLHNENSYGHSWPLKIFFMCLTPPETGGETPLADCRKIFARIPTTIRDTFMQRKICYVRNYGEGFGLPWQTVFQTEDKAAVEAYCQSVGLEFEWKKGNALRTRKVGRAVYQHPITGEWVWFNHATFFHISTLPPEIREPLLREFGEEGLSSNSYYGDGSPIEPEVLETLRETYRQETVKFKWHSGDVLLLDNMLTAHGRAAYSGPRKVVVAMSEPQVEDSLVLELSPVRTKVDKEEK